MCINYQYCFIFLENMSTDGCSSIAKYIADIIWGKLIQN